VANDERIGITTAGQRTTEAVGGVGERGEAIRHTRDLLLRRALEVLYVSVWVPLIVGPWILSLYVPALFGWAMPRLGRWLWPGEEQDRVDPLSLIAIGALVGAIVMLAPPEARAWWPLRWVWAHWEPRWIWARVVALLLPLIPWRIEEPHLTNRQRQETELPTVSGAAFASPAPHQVAIRGWRNPFRDPNAPALPAPAPEVTRTLFWRPDTGGANGARIVDCPADVANGMQLEELAHLVIELGIPPTRAQVMRRGIFTDPGWRAFVDWCVERGLMVKTGEARSAPYVMSEEGAVWLTTLVEGTLA
jgi:hypothetical protein